MNRRMEGRRSPQKRRGGGSSGGIETTSAKEREWSAHSIDPLDNLPGWAAPVVFALVTILLFREFVFTDRMLYGGDTLTMGYMARAFFADALRTTGFPLWNPVILGGSPFLESLAGGDSLYPPSFVLLFLTELYRSLGWKLVVHVFLAGCFMYAWLRILGVSRGGALVGGLGYLLAPYMVTLVYPGHDGKIFVTALTPLLFWVSEWMWTRRDLLPAAALGGVVALVLLTTHFQMAYFLFGGVGAYMVFRTLLEGRGDRGWAPAVRRFGVFLGFSVLGAGAAGIQLIPAVEYVTEHSRRTFTTVQAEAESGVVYASSWSLHPEEAVSLIVPEFVGSSAGGAEWASDTYWGRNPFKLNHEYLGLVALLLAGMAFLGARLRALRWFLLGMGSIYLFFSLGTHTPIWRIFYEVVPGISLFRAPSMAIFMTGFAVASLAGLGVDRSVALVTKGDQRRVLRVAGIVTGVLGLGWLLALSGGMTGLWTSVFGSGMTQTRLDALERAGPFISRGFFVATALAGATLLIWWGLAKGVLSALAAVSLLAGLVAVDQVRINDAFIQTLDYRDFATPDGNQRFLMEQSSSEPPFRVFSMMQSGQDVAPGMHGLELAGGHHPNDLGRYRELIGMEGSGIPENLAFFHPNVLRMLNVRYVLWPDFQYGPLEGVEPLSRLTFAGDQPYQSVYPYPGLPRARLVGEALVVGEHETLEVVLDPERYDPTYQVVLTEPPPLELGGGAVEGEVIWIDRSPNRIVLDVDASTPALLVLAENWFPAWHATVDGEEVDVIRADHTLRAVPVPGGRHRVEFYYRSRMLRMSLALTVASILLLSGIAVASTLRSRREPA